MYGGVCDVNSSGIVTYSGNTFIRIRSGKHDTSNAYTYAHDMRELFLCNLVPMKPILLIEIDGVQDQAPRFPKTLTTAISHFKELNLDALLRGVNAAGLSAFNPVERRMAPLSHDLAGIILPHDPLETIWMWRGKPSILSWKKRTSSKRLKHYLECGLRS